MNMRTTHKAVLGAGAIAVAVSAFTLSTASGEEANNERLLSIASNYRVMSEKPEVLSAEAAAMTQAVANRAAASDLGVRADTFRTWRLRVAGAQTTYLLANDKLACLIGYGPQRYFSCTPAAVATSRTQAMVNLGLAGGDRTTVEMLASDAVSTAWAVSPTGQQTPLDVSNNLASGTVTGPVAAVRWTNTDGSTGETALARETPPPSP